MMQITLTSYTLLAITFMLVTLYSVFMIWDALNNAPLIDREPIRMRTNIMTRQQRHSVAGALITIVIIVLLLIAFIASCMQHSS